MPFSGEKFDGHMFINEVFAKGVKYSFCEKSKTSGLDQSKLIVVENTLDAYHKIANYYRRKINPIVIAVTGSSGKTTVKELIATVLNEKYRVHKTEANFNNEIGVPKTILEMPKDTDVLVLELAMRGKGEIRYLSGTSEPDVAIITNVGSSHVGRLGSLQGIIEAKCEIFEYLKEDGIAFLHNDSTLLNVCRNVWPYPPIMFDLAMASKVTFCRGESHFVLEGENYFINVQGKIHITNAVLAIKLAKHKKFDLSKEAIQRGLEKFEIPAGRGNVIRLENDIYLIDESYNANPDSLKAAVSNLVDCWDQTYKKILVLGELAELGGHEGILLKDLGMWLRDMELTKIIIVGEDFGNNCRDAFKGVSTIYVKDVDECCNILKALLVPKLVVLIKGSHAAFLDKVVEYFQKGNHGKTKNKN